MNLIGMGLGQIQGANPNKPVTLQLSTPYTTNADGTQTPGYATPGAFTANITGLIMTVSAVAGGVLLPGQQIAGVSVLPGTAIQSQVSGSKGQAGVYQLIGAAPQTVESEAMMTTYVVPGNQQALQYKDLIQVAGLNLNGTRRKFYLYGDINGVVRPNLKGGDLITDSAGSVWLTAMVVEHWENAAWCSVAVTLQDGS